MSLERDDAVVILLDCMEGTAASVFPDSQARSRFVAPVVDLVRLAAANDIPVVCVDVEFRHGHVEVPHTNRYFTKVKAAGRLLAGSSQTMPMSELAAPVSRVVKRRIGAFAGSDLEWVLRGLGRSHLLLAGLVTRGAILSTACHAADLDYQVTVVGDACFDPDPDVHRVLLGSVLPMRAAVMSVAEVAAALPPEG